MKPVILPASALIAFLALTAGALYFYTNINSRDSKKSSDLLQHATSSTQTDLTKGTTTLSEQTARLRVVGSDLIAPDGNKIVLRGFNWGGFNTGMAESEDALDMVRMGANTVRIPLRWRFTEDSKQDQYDPDAPGLINPNGVATLEKQIAWAGSQKLWVVLFVGSDPVWTDQKMLDEYATVWEFLAQHFKDTPYIAGYEILSEPHPKDRSSDVVKDFFVKNIAAIRKNDTRTPTIVGPASATDCTNGPYDIRCLPRIYLNNMPNMIYTYNFYEPAAYVKDKDGDKKDDRDGQFGTYPGTYTNRQTGETYHLDRAWIANLMQHAANFKKAHNVPLFVNQIGVPSIAPGSDQYTKDTLGVLNDMEIGYTWWIYRLRNTKHALSEGGRGVLWEDELGTWHRKEEWITLLSQLFMQPLATVKQ